MDEIRRMAEARFGDMVKAVVDLERGIMMLDAEMRADAEAELLAGGSEQPNLWGIINLRPSHGNRSRGVEDATTRERIAALVQRLVRR